MSANSIDPSSAQSPPSTVAVAASTDPRIATPQVPSSPTSTNPVKSHQKPQLPHPNISPFPSNSVHPNYHLLPPNRPNGPYLLNGNPNPRNPKMTSNCIPPTLPPQGMLYPVASSGRGYAQWPQSQPPDPTFYHRAPIGPPYTLVDHSVTQLHQLAYRGQQFSQSINLVRQTSQNPGSKAHPIAANGAVSGNSRMKAQAIPPPPASNRNGLNDFTDGAKEEKVVTVRGRKVRIVEGASLYSLCRSWLRNGQDEEAQPNSENNIRALPPPLSLAMVEAQYADQNENDNDDDNKNEEAEDEASVDHLTPQELLKQHIQLAKRVRARFKKDRRKRIERYKTRLSLLLPPQEQV